MAYYMSFSFAFVVVQERAKLTRVHVIYNEEKKFLVEFEDLAVLLHDLPYAVDELQEYGRTILVRVFVRAMTHSL